MSSSRNSTINRQAELPSLNQGYPVGDVSLVIEAPESPPPPAPLVCHYTPRRDREVSSVGPSSPSTRSTRRQAKRERRQAQKDDDIDDAFAGNTYADKDDTSLDANTACLVEIVVPALHNLPTTEGDGGGVAAPDMWAASILDSTNGSSSQVSSSRGSLRRGKRDVMNTWLCNSTSADVSVELQSPQICNTSLTHACGGILSPCQESPPVRHYLMSAPGHGNSSSTSTTTNQLLTVPSPTSCPRPHRQHKQHHPRSHSISSTLPLMPHLQHPSNLGESHHHQHQQKQQHSMYPRPIMHPSSLCTTQSSGESPHVAGRRSRPRDAIRSIRSYRQLGESIGDHVTPPSELKIEVDMPPPDQEEESSTPVSACAICLFPTSKSRHVVQFNKDVYNIHNWNSEDYGPFALTTNSMLAPVSASPRLQSSTSNSPSTTTFAQSPKVRTPPNFTLEEKKGMDIARLFECEDTSMQGSLNVLTAYFDEMNVSSPAGITPTMDPTCNNSYNPGIFTTSPPPTPTTTTTTIQKNVGHTVGGDTLGDSLDTSLNSLSFSFNVHTGSLRPTNLNRPPVSSGSVFPAMSMMLPSSSTGLPLKRSGQKASQYNSNTSSVKYVRASNVHPASIRTHLLQVATDHVTSTSPSILVSNQGRLFKKVSATTMDLCVSHNQNSSPLHDPSTPSFSSIVGKLVTVDTLIHHATSYTHQLANPTSGAGYQSFRRLRESWTAGSSLTDSDLDDET